MILEVDRMVRIKVYLLWNNYYSFYFTSLSATGTYRYEINSINSQEYWKHFNIDYK